MAQYDHEHGSPWNKLLHAVGIPLIFAGMTLLVLLRWHWGVSCVVGGWLLLLVGHWVEGNNPAFFQGAIYLLVGPIWVAKEIGTIRSGAERGQEHDVLPPKRF
jgi:uncharacterized membrane protein YGL010W